MMTRHRPADARENGSCLTWGCLGLAMVAVAALVLGTGTASAERRGRYCSSTATTQFLACWAEVRDDVLSARAICLNASDDEERAECYEEAEEARVEGQTLCREQRAAREHLCTLVGQGRYDPSFEPEDFEDDFHNLVNPNPYFPLEIGNHWSYESEDESNTVEVLDETKLIEGVTCVVIRDLVSADPESEDTDDWYGQRKNGNVDYCGEEVKDFETFAGDDPMLPELVSIDGSFKAGRDGDRPGTLFLANPYVGATYRQEWSAGNAEDAATVLSTTYGPGNQPELDAFVPEGLAELLCSNHDCVVTRDFTPIEPDVFERKYYARGLGLFLEVKPEDGEVNQLVDCNFDARCASLPTP